MLADKATIAAVLDEAFPGDVGSMAMTELRLRRQQCEVVESELSYRRRLLHGHLDLLRAELARRDLGTPAGPVTGLLDSLGEHGAASQRSPSHQRLMVDFEVGEPDGPMSADLPDCSDDELHARGEAWILQERLLSDQRRTVLARMDVVQDEIVRRYRDGAASIDEILPSST